MLSFTIFTTVSTGRSQRIVRVVVVVVVVISLFQDGLYDMILQISSICLLALCIHIFTLAFPINLLIAVRQSNLI